MTRKVILFILLLTITATMSLVSVYEPFEHSTKVLYTLIWLSLTYAVFKIVLEGILIRHVRLPKNKYAFRKISSLLFYTVFFAITAALWIENAQSILVTLGLVSAAIAFSMQDVFKNLAGGISILILRPYNTGDRIEIAGKMGDVVDISLFYTTILEMREWIKGDQPTGRITSIPNGVVLTNPANNYTKDQPFIWDEIMIPLTYGSDLTKARRIMLEVAERETHEYAEEAYETFSNLQEKYYLPHRSTAPQVFMELTGEWISAILRYSVPAQKRRMMHNTLSVELWDELKKEKKVKVASPVFSPADLSKR